MKETQLETSDELRQHIDGLREKLEKAEAAEAAEDLKAEQIELPVMECEVFVAKGHTVFLKGVTPPEALILTAMHNKAVGDVPIRNMKVTGAVKVDARSLVARLAGKYGAKRVLAVFPGTDPKLPTTFRKALTAGIGTVLPEQHLMDYEVKPDNVAA